MNCQDYHSYLQRLLDGDSPGEEDALGEHLAQCAQCRAWHAAALRLAAGLHLLQSPIPPAGLTDRVFSRALAERRQRVSWRRRLTTLAVAASLLFVSLAGYAHWFRLASGRPEPPVASNSRESPGETESPHLPLANVTSLRESVTEVGSLVASLGRRTVDQTVVQSGPLLPVLVPPGWEGLDFEQPLTPSAQGVWDAGEGMATGLKPITNSARRALDLFRREVPPLSVQGKQG
jgi:anti-sigma factor RsiW